MPPCRPSNSGMGSRGSTSTDIPAGATWWEIPCRLAPGYRLRCACRRAVCTSKPSRRRTWKLRTLAFQVSDASDAVAVIARNRAARILVVTDPRDKLAAPADMQNLFVARAGQEGRSSSSSSTRPKSCIISRNATGHWRCAIAFAGRATTRLRPISRQPSKLFAEAGARTKAAGRRKPRRRVSAPC